MYFTDRGIEELADRRGEELVTLEWVSDQLRTFVDLNPEFETPIERLASWLARLDDEELDRLERISAVRREGERYWPLPAFEVALQMTALDIPFDSLKLKVGGGHGGHNGIRDVAKALGTADFPRVRVGIGRPPGRQDPADWVLDPFGSAERGTLPMVLSDAADAVELLIRDGLEPAQNTVHAW